MKVSLLFVVILYSCLLIFSHLPLTYAGSFTTAPITVYGTSITVSVSYPDSFHFNDPTNISITITVNFYNESISAVNVTAIHVRLYYSDANLTEKAGYPSPTLQESYAYAEWLSTDYYGSSHPPATPFPHKIERLSAYVATGSWDVSLSLSY